MLATLDSNLCFTATRRKAEHVIFYARYEASQFGTAYIEAEHLLLGLLYVDEALANRFIYPPASVESVRKQIEERAMMREKVSASPVDLPLSNESKRVLAYAAEEAQMLSDDKHIGTAHLLLGMLRQPGNFAADFLNERGLILETVRTQIGTQPDKT